MRLLALLLPATYLAQAGSTVTNTLVVSASNATGGPPHAWIGGGTALAVAEDGATTVSLPFTVAAFGDAYDTATITSDGAILFEGALPAGCPSTAAAGSGVAVLSGPLDGARVTTDTVGAWPNRVFVVSWNDVRLDGGTATGRVQAWLLEGRAEVVVVHDDVAFASGATVRAGAWGGDMGVDWLCDVAPVSGRSAWLADRGVRPSRPSVTAEELAMPWYGNFSNDGAGEVIAAGDLNGDGLADLAIGSPSLGGGVVAVVARPADGGRLDDVPVHVTHPSSGAALGRALAFADLDADGRDELIAGAPQAASGAGEVYAWENVLSGAEQSPSTAVAAWQGPGGSRYGTALAVGDADGDGADDLLVGAPNYAAGPNALAGSAWLLRGGAGGSWRGAHTASTDSAFHRQGGSAGEGLGQSVLLVDLDADGDRDAVLGAPFKEVGGQMVGAVNAWVLSPGAPGVVSGAASWIVTGPGPATGGRFGWSLAAGALTGAIGQDVVVGAPYASVGGANEGHVFVYADPGAAAGVPAVSHAIGFQTVQDRTSARLGQALAVADIDVDGDDDLVIGAPNETTTASGAGVMYVLRDATWTSVMHVDDADVVVEGVHGGALLGASLAAVPETDRTPVFVAAPGDSWGSENAGSVYSYTWRADFVDDDGDGQVTADVGGPDCDDTDPAAYAGAVELVGDGIDADCDGWRDGRVATRTTVAGWNHDVAAWGGAPASFDTIGFEQFSPGASVASVADVTFSPALTVDSVVYGALPEGARGAKRPLPPPSGAASVTLDFGVPTDVLALSVLDGVGAFTLTASDGAGNALVAWTQDLDAQDRPGGAFLGMNFSRPICAITLQGPAYTVHPSFGLDAIRYRDAGTVEEYGNDYDDDCDGRVDGGSFVVEDDEASWGGGLQLQAIDFDAIGEDENIALQYADRGVTFTPDAGASFAGAAMVGPVAAFGVRAGEVDGGVTLAFLERQPAVGFSVVGGPGTLAVEGWVDGERVYTRTVTYATTLPTTTGFVGLTFEMPVDELRIASGSVAFGIDDLRFGALGLDDADGDGYTERQGDCDDADAAVSPDLSWYEDADGDGHGAPDAVTDACEQPAGHVATGDDCDDAAPSVHPGATEICDADDVDEDCDGVSDDADASVSVATFATWYADVDSDGYGDPARTLGACDVPTGRPEAWVAQAGDCAPANPAVSPGASEICDAADVDEDCDGKADDDDSSADPASRASWYPDTDGDTFGDMHVPPVLACAQPAGSVANDDDCDDLDADVSPLLAWYVDADSDGYGDGDAIVYGCLQPAGAVAEAGDCDDGRADVNPGAAEACDPLDLDEDCDGASDDDDLDSTPVNRTARWRDVDGDGYGAPGPGVPTCDPLAGYAQNDDDCDDARGDVSPAGSEVCDPANADEDCDGTVEDADTSVAPASRTSWYADADADGWGDIARVRQGCDVPTGLPESWVARPGDCLDSRPDVSPDGAEVCDAANVDEDCDGMSDDMDASVSPATLATWYADADADGYGDVDAPEAACDLPAGHVADSSDCDDDDATLSPDTVWFEDVDGDGLGDAASTRVACVRPTGFVANDDDCDDTSGLVGVAATWFVDGDSDGFGDAQQPVAACEQPAGTVAVATDCDDGDDAISPVATEVCDAADVDEDCDGLVDDADPGVAPGGRSTWFADGDADGFGDPSRPAVTCDAPAGHVANDGDCDDVRGDVSPAGSEVCDAANADEDCDGAVEDADPSLAPSSRTAWYADADGDGWGDPARVQQGCDVPMGLPEAWVAAAGDCDPQRAAIHPGATEVCDAADVDEDCDGASDDADPGVQPATRSTWYADADSDGYGDAAVARAACDMPSGFVADSSDCADARGDVHPGATEVCDADDTDEDCDGQVDDADPGVDPASRLVHYRDVDGDGYGVASESVLSCDPASGYAAAAGDCDDGDASLSPATRWYLDQDGDSFGDPAVSVASCAPVGGHVRLDTDCDDDDAAVNPSAVEVCDAGDVDEDCDGVADDADPDVDPAGHATWYADADADGYGDPGVPESACDVPDGFVADSADCDDTDAAVTPQTAWYADDDGDGHGDAAFPWGAPTCTRPAGYAYTDDDCAPDDPDVHPGADEVCNESDDDCDGDVDDDDAGVIGLPWYADADADGFGSAVAAPVAACLQPAGTVADRTDCDDTRAGVHPGAVEVCDPHDADEDCDGDVDDDDASLDLVSRLTWYRDADADGHGDADTSARACAAPGGHVASADDCDDDAAAVNPGAAEVCDAADVDEDCDGLRDDADPGVQAAGFATWYADLDRDGFGDAGSSVGRCDAADGWVSDATDCDDTEANVNPAAVEVCDDFGGDEDCDGFVDDSDADVDPASFLTWYADADGDTWGDSGAPTAACAAPSGFVADATDCDDDASAVNPGAQEVCDPDDVDEDCDGSADDSDTSVLGSGRTAWHVDSDGDSFGHRTQTVSRCDVTAGLVADASDCDDADAAVNPSATEVCDAADVDEDCDGDADDADADVQSAGFVPWYADTDGDGWGDASSMVAACDAPDGHVDDDTDCDDARAAVHPGAQEVCDAADRDEDCDGAVDDADASVADASRSAWYADADTDGFGAWTDVTRACAAPAGRVADATDCDDTRAGVNPAAFEACDAADLDEDCDGQADDDDAQGASGKQARYADGDGDGVGAGAAAAYCDVPSGWVARNDDCDDTTGLRSPLNAEACDAADVDEDCDGQADDGDPEGASGKLTRYADADGDGVGAGAAATYCDAPSGWVARNDDCDDTTALRSPLNAEACDAAELDEDCDLAADDSDPEGASGKVTRYADVDADGWGDADTVVTRCDAPSGYVANDGDCDDTDDAVHPAASEACDGDDVDEDCDGLADDDDGSVDPAGFLDWYGDVDGDGYGDPDAVRAACDVPTGHVANDEDCDDADASRNPETAWFADADGDGFGDASDERVQCALPEGYVRVSTDCDDTRATVHPGAPEVCDADARDEDCDGLADDADADVLPASRRTWYRDGDADGYGRAGEVVATCAQPSGHVARAQDCDDTRGAVYPGASDAPYDGLDADCGGDDDFDADDDGLAPVAYGGTDCDDTSRAIRPGAQDFPYDGIDSNCDGADDYDRDSDGFVVAWYGGVDCDDTDATVGPGAIDPAYDGIDSNCDGADEYDVDGDGWDAVEAGGADCDDGDATVHPGASDAPGDGVDADCDGADPVGGTCPDCDGDGHEAGADCDDTDPAVHPGASDAPYDGRDTDCASDDDYDADHDGARAAGYGGTDCDDTDPARHPGVASDGCGRGDEDCDGTTDEDCVIVPEDTGDTGGDTGGSDTGPEDTGHDTGSGPDTGTQATPPTTTEPQAPAEVPRGLRGCATAPGAPSTGLALVAACLALALRRRGPSRSKDSA